jgi:RNA polymerase sigma-70 factor (ECF subfamily)
MVSPDSKPNSAAADRFATTRWSVVVAAKGPSSPPVQEALAILCATYWYPLYAYIRHQGFSVEQTEDLTQGFFANLLEQHSLQVVDRAKGKFRAFLLTACKHYLANERRRAKAQKRGGGRTFLSLDFEDAEARYRQEPVDKLTPEKLFERRWVLALLDQVLGQLRQEFVDKGKGKLFDRLRVFLLGQEGVVPHGRVAEELDMTPGAVKVAVHRLRRRFRELVRAEIARTVDSAEAVDDEIRELFAALAN